MAFEELNPDTLKGGDHYVTVYESLGGWKWVDIWANNVDKIGDLEYFMEPWSVSEHPYATQAEACVDAYTLAEMLDLPYALAYLPGHPDYDAAQQKMDN